MDHEYNVCDLRGPGEPTFEQALLVDARVVSANTAGMVTIDAGLKAMAHREGGPPMILEGRRRGSTTRFMGDEHLAVLGPEGRRRRARRAGDPDAAALRSDGQSLRRLSRGEGRHAGRDLAGHGARVAVGSRHTSQSGSSPPLGGLGEGAARRCPPLSLGERNTKDAGKIETPSPQKSSRPR